jgi:pimeloyl-ACP methyl ester carboxylesterase
LPWYYEDIVTVLETVVNRSAVIVGFSLGGVVAWRLAQRRPDLVQAVFLEDPPFYPESGNSGDAVPVFLRETIRLEQDWHARGVGIEIAGRELASTSIGPGKTLGDVMFAQSLQLFAKAILLRDRGVTEAAIERSMITDFDSAQLVRVPTLVLGADDTLGAAFTRASAQRFSAIHPHSEIHRADDAPHPIHLSYAGRALYVRLLTDFLARHAPTDRATVPAGLKG